MLDGNWFIIKLIWIYIANCDGLGLGSGDKGIYEMKPELDVLYF